jgi:hydrogenase maturation protein HypF
VHVTGVVQGVGFRPFVYNLARRLGVTGWVLNSSEGVFAHAEGEDDAVDAFVRDIVLRAPPMAVVDSLISEVVPAEGFTDFAIRESTSAGGMTLVSPDIATCEACGAEIRDPDDRRYRYPFTNCTNCGPRFTIIEDVPYDRPVTTMRDFPMCEACAAEYGDPSDRRFHAQPNACPVCGPRLFLNVSGVGATTLPADLEWTAASEPVPRSHQDPAASRERTDAVLATAVELLRSGRILAIKGLGGFHLACDATDEDAVCRLRGRKHRHGKPLAIMVPSIEMARELALVGPEEEALLLGIRRPIVLLRLKSALAEDGEGDASLEREPVRLAPALAPGLREIGVMLPYTPLHHILLDDFGAPLVMTSGNLSEEPIATGNAEALERLSGIADAFLLHDRGIYSRYDDSVTRVVEGHTEIVRRARGHAPFPLTLPFAAKAHILGAGSEQKNTFTLLKDGYAFVSQHIGDLENAETLESYEQTLALYERLFRVGPEVVAYDLHPEYLSTKYALALGLPAVGVQHHHAHIVAVTAEHDVRTDVIGVAFDGTGYGSDGHIWGGEVLISRWADFERYAHLTEVPMPGGAAAVRRPARMALGLLKGLGGGLFEHPGAAQLRSRIGDNERDVILAMIDKGLNSPPTSSMGRLFDAVAAIIGLRDDADYEGQAAMELEALADLSAEGSYEFDLTGDAPLIIDPRPVVGGVLEDLAAGTATPVIAMRFHRAVVRAIVATTLRAARDTGGRDVALAGGVFLNRLVLGGAMRGLAAEGLRILTHKGLPTNDGAISYGQAVAAWARLDQA